MYNFSDLCFIQFFFIDSLGLIMLDKKVGTWNTVF